MIAPGQALPRVHMMICCPGSTSLPRGKFIEIWSLRIYLNSFSFYTNCYREWILNTFTYFWCFLELFYWKFILNINNEHAQDYSCPGATFAFCSHGETLPRQGGLPGVVQRVTRLSKLPRGNEKLMWTVTGVRPCTEAKLTPGSVSCPGAMSCPGIMWTGPKGLFTWTRDSELPRGNGCPGASVTSRSHDDLLSRDNVAPGQLDCPGASSTLSNHYEFIRIPLLFAQILTKNEF